MDSEPKDHIRLEVKRRRSDNDWSSHLRVIYGYSWVETSLRDIASGSLFGPSCFTSEFLKERGWSFPKDVVCISKNCCKAFIKWSTQKWVRCAYWTGRCKKTWNKMDCNDYSIIGETPPSSVKLLLMNAQMQCQGSNRGVLCCYARSLL